MSLKIMPPADAELKLVFGSAGASPSRSAALVELRMKSCHGVVCNRCHSVKIRTGATAE